MLGMIFVADSFEKIRVADEATAILRWAGALAVDQLRIALPFGRRQNLLDLDFVPPTIAEIVFVQESRAFSAYSAVEPRAKLVPEFTRRFIQIKCRIGVLRIVGLEAMQVRMCPSHPELEYPVQTAERRIAGDEQAPPDGRINIAESDFELVYLRRFRLYPLPAFLYGTAAPSCEFLGVDSQEPDLLLNAAPEGRDWIGRDRMPVTAAGQQMLGQVPNGHGEDAAFPHMITRRLFDLRRVALDGGFIPNRSGVEVDAIAPRLSVNGLKDQRVAAHRLAGAQPIPELRRSGRSPNTFAEMLKWQRYAIAGAKS